MAEEKIRMPSGMGGLTRFSDEETSKLKFAPGHIVVLCLVVIIIVLLLHYFGGFLVQ